MFTHSVNVYWSRSHGVVEIIKQIITRNWTYELRHEFPNNLALKILGNEEFLRLFTCVFTNLMTRGFELLTRGFELVTRELELETCRFKLVTREL